MKGKQNERYLETMRHFATRHQRFSPQSTTLTADKQEKTATPPNLVSSENESTNKGLDDDLTLFSAPVESRNVRRGRPKPGYCTLTCLRIRALQYSTIS